MTKILTRSAILKNYQMKDVVDAVESAYKLLHDGKIVVPPRMFTPTVEGGDYLYSGVTNLAKETFIVRGSAFHPWYKNDPHHEVVTGYYMYSSFRTGELLAIINGVDVVKLRTGAKSAVAAKYLAKKDSKTLGLIGLGNQAKTQAEAIATQFKLNRIVGYSRNEKNAQPTLQAIRKTTNIGVEYLPLASVVEQADILVFSTFSKTPLISFKDLHPGQLVISLAHSEEVDRDIAINAKSYVDYHPSAQNEGGPVKAAVDDGAEYQKVVTGDLTELVGKAIKGREADSEIIYFQSLGVSHEDLAAVEYLYDLLKSSAPEISLE